MRAFSGICVLLVFSCGGSNDEVASGPDGSGGSEVGAMGGAGQPGGVSTGGAKGTGGATGTGGAKGTGGATGTGGAKGTGGATGTGGAKGVGGAGGSSASGGTPAVDAGPTVIHDCAGLAATGQWEPISPPGDTGDSQAVIVHPKESGTVFVDMHKGGNGAHYPTDGLYKSTDCGSSWTKMSTGRNSDLVNTGSWSSFAIDYVNPDNIYAIDIYGAGGLYKSTNGGVDWDQMVPQSFDTYIHSMFFDSVSMDPNDPNHLVVGTHQGCAPPYDPSCQVETTDGGATWKIIRLPWGWGETAGPWVVGKDTWLYPGDGLSITTDDGATWHKVSAPDAYYQGGEEENHVIPMRADGTYYMSSSLGIVKSKDIKNWTLIPNSGGRSVGFAMGGGMMYTSDQWSASYHYATEADDTTWTELPPPATLPKDQGAPFLSYDAGHHLLYSSNFAGRLWRVVTP